MSAIVAGHLVNSETHVHVERPESSLSQKVQKVAFEGLYWVIWGFVALLGTVTAIPVGTAMHYRYNSEKEFSGTIHVLAKSRYYAVREAIGNSVNTFLDLQDVTLYDIRNSHGQAIYKLKGNDRERCLCT